MCVCCACYCLNQASDIFIRGLLPSVLSLSCYTCFSKTLQVMSSTSLQCSVSFILWESWTCIFWLYFFLYHSFHPNLTLLYVCLQLPFSSAAFSVFFTLNHQRIDRWNFTPGPHKDRRQWKTAGTVTWIFQMKSAKSVFDRQKLRRK